MTTQGGPQAPSLRERRRREMARSIANAAVELFERNGVAATTADDIAAAVGISRTTFFRHCAGKEAAVLADDGGFAAELVEAAASASIEHPRGELDRIWAAMTAAFDADPAGHDRFLRVRRLMHNNPSLVVVGREQNAALAERLAQALHERAGVAELDAHAVAQSFALVMHLSFDEWVRRVDQRVEGVTLQSVADDVAAAFARATQGERA